MPLVVVPSYRPERAEWLHLAPWQRFPIAFALLEAWEETERNRGIYFRTVRS